MALKIYNSLTRTKEEFKPLDPSGKIVKMYVCGPTVYDEPHIGHLRSAYVFDMIRRYLESSGWRVRFVRNITDVDDKIIEKARGTGAKDLNAETAKVSAEYFDLYKKDLKALGIADPTVEPRATAYIGEMVELIQKLVAKGAAYETEGDVYFSVGAFADYGKLSHQQKEAMLESARVEKNEKKHDPLDFALWKKAKPDEPAWDSPWGKGRPGWHIECSAMSLKCLEAETIDIHGGGLDLIFPHHENEIAQSESATGKPFARYWIHHGLVTRDGRKMSKSLKNYLTLAHFSGSAWGVDELKFLFLSAHHAAPLDYSEEGMKAQKAVCKRFTKFFEDLKPIEKTVKAKRLPDVSKFENAFHEAMDDDFNTPKALAVMHEIVHEARKRMEKEDKEAALALGRCLKAIGDLFLLPFDGHLRIGPDRNMDEVTALVEERLAARRRGDFKQADLIRQRLLKEFFVEVMDLKDGRSAWRIV